MAKKRQFLINYHTSGATNMPLATDVKKGEIVVRHSAEKPELLILTDNEQFATFVDKTAVSGMLATEVSSLTNKIDAVDGKLANYATTAVTNALETKFKDYLTEEETQAAIKAVDDKFSDYTTTAATETAIATVQGEVDALGSVVNAKVSALTETINTKVSAVFVYKGSCNYADLPTNLTAAEKGYVYNVIDSYNNVPAGTNYAWNGDSWDALAGTVDLTIYATSANTHAAITTVDGKVDTLSNKLTTDYALSAVTAAEIKAVDDKFAGYATTAVTNAFETKFKDYATSANTHAAITTVDGKVDTLTNRVNTIASFSADTAVQTIEVLGFNETVSTKKEGTAYTIDFSNMVIDGGEF